MNKETAIKIKQWIDNYLSAKNAGNTALSNEILINILAFLDGYSNAILTNEKRID